MSLSTPVLGALIDSNLQAAGANGSNKTIFSNAIAKGIVETLVGASFTTSDTGTVTGSGTGTGTGITGLSSSAMKSTALSLMSSQGVNADKMMQAIMDAVVSHLSSSASLSSTHFPVFLGTGTINVGSIAVISSAMSGNIDSELQGAGAEGINRTQLSVAIGTGIVTNILSSGSGTVNITGSPIGDTSPGSGSGSGTIS